MSNCILQVSTLADPGAGNPATAPVGMSVALVSPLSRLVPPPQPAKNFAGADGHWAIFSIHHANLHVGLLNLLSRVFTSQNGQQCVGCREELFSAPQTPYMD